MMYNDNGNCDAIIMETVMNNGGGNCSDSGSNCNKNSDCNYNANVVVKLMVVMVGISDNDCARDKGGSSDSHFRTAYLHFFC